MRVGKYTIFFPIQMSVRHQDFTGKISKGQIKKIVKNEVFDAVAETMEVTDVNKKRAWYLQVESGKTNRTFLEMVEYQKDETLENGLYILPHTIIRNSINEYPCIVTFPEEKVTMIFNEKGLLDSYYKDLYYDINEKIRYFTQKYSDYPTLLYSNSELEDLNYQPLVLSSKIKKKGGEEIFRIGFFFGIGGKSEPNKEEGKNIETKETQPKSQFLFVVLLIVAGFVGIGYQNLIIQREMVFKIDILNKNLSKDIKDGFSQIKIENKPDVLTENVKNIEMRMDSMQMILFEIKDQIQNTQPEEKGQNQLQINKEIDTQDIKKLSDIAYDKNKFQINGYVKKTNKVTLLYRPNLKDTYVQTIELKGKWQKTNTFDYQYSIELDNQRILVTRIVDGLSFEMLLK